MNSLQEHLASQKPAAVIFDSALNLSTRTVKSLNNAVKRDKNPLLWDLISEISNASGILYQLSHLVRDGTLFWAATVWTLCATSGPIEGFTANMELLISKFSPISGLKALGAIVKPSTEELDVADIQRATGRQNVVFLTALQNDHVCVFRFSSMSCAHRTQGFVKGNGDCISKHV